MGLQKTGLILPGLGLGDPIARQQVEVKDVLLDRGAGALRETVLGLADARHPRYRYAPGRDAT